MKHALLALPITTPLALGITSAVVAIVVLVLLSRRRPHWLRTVLVSLVLGAVVAGVVLWLAQGPLDLVPTLVTPAQVLVVLAGASIGLALANLHRARAWRRVVAVAAVPVLLGAAAIGVNAAYGINSTLGAMIGHPVSVQLDLPVATGPAPAATSTGPLWQTWHAPAGMPSTGRVGAVDIPPTASGFVARQASVYLPPAALVADPPALPVIVFMMGQPGNPDATFNAAALDKLAAAHGGLAPIAVVVDQLGSPTVDSLCLDTPNYGNVQTYVNVDVVAWVRTHLRVLPDRDHWAVGGYSNGGQCAFSFLPRYPTIWGNALSISGEEYPGAEHPAQVLADVFHGNQAAYDAVHPTALFAKAAPLTDTWLIATAANDDPAYVAQAKKVAAAAQAAGVTATVHVFPTGGHLVPALQQGLDHGLGTLYSRWGLSAG